MSFTRFLAVARKEVVQILRDSRSLIIVVIMPVILVLLFGYGVNLDLKGLPVYVYDRDGSQQSQDLLKRFQASEYFDVVRVVNDYPALARSLDDGHAKIGIVIPWDFSQRLHDGRPAQVQALVDGSDDNTANVLIGYRKRLSKAIRRTSNSSGFAPAANLSSLLPSVLKRAPGTTRIWRAVHSLFPACLLWSCR